MRSAIYRHGSVRIVLAKMLALSPLVPGPVAIYFTTMTETGILVYDEVELAILVVGARGAAAAKVSSKSTAVSGKSVGTAHRAEAPLLSLPGRPRSERVALVALSLARAADACFRPSSAGHCTRCPSY